MSAILFLDVDGVLNCHSLPGKDGGLRVELCTRLFDVVMVANCHIVLSSAWRYMGHGCNSVFRQCLRGVLHHAFAGLLADRIIGATRLESQPEPKHLAILDWVREHRPECWVAVDDMDDIRELGEGHYVQTDGKVGITDADARRLVELLKRSA